jgi:thioredoxin reductase (NADPH)
LTAEVLTEEENLRSLIKKMIKTDILIIGAGPTGLFTVFEAGLLKLKCHLIDALPQPGGQCSEIYPKKPIYDIPAYPEILAGDLTERLMEQIKPFEPGFTLGERADTIDKLEDGTFIVTTNRGTKHHAPIVAIAGGLGSFEPRKPPIANIAQYEDKGVEYIIRDPEIYRNKKVVIAGGGDSALDWSIFLTDVASEVTLVHRRNEFRGALDSVDKVQELKDAGKINLITPAEVKEIHGEGHVTGVTIVQNKTEQMHKDCDHFIPLFGLSPKLGPIANWGLEIEKNAIKVNNALDYQTNIPGIYAIGDVNTYPGKLKLILCGFHEATLMCQSAYQRIFPDKKYVMKYTTVGGVEGFDGTKKEAPKAVVKKIS